MAKTRYPGLSQIKDPATQAAFKLLCDKIGAVETSAESIGAVSKPLAAALDSGGNRLTAVADPAHLTDAVNLQTLQKYVDSALSLHLNPPGSAPVIIPGVPGSGPQPPNQPSSSPPTPTTPSNLICFTSLAGGQPGGVPPAPNLRWFRGDFCGVTVPSLPVVPGSAVDPAVLFSPSIDRYVLADRLSVYDAMHLREYTHFVVSWPDSRSGAGQSIAQFVTTCQEIQANGFYPCIFLSSKDWDPSDVPTIMAGLVPVLAALQAANVIPIACVGWELSLWLDPDQVQDLIDRLTAVLVPTTNLYVHFQEDYIAWPHAGSVTAEFWQRNVGKLTGLWYQKQLSQDCGLFQARIADGTSRFAGNFGFPADSGFGHPFDYVVFEYSASPRYANGMTEAQALQIGFQGICAPGALAVSGFCNGGPIV